MAQKREGRGRPEKDDQEAISYAWRLHRENPRIGYREAARRYFQEHPERLGKATLESAARRVGDKAARFMTIPTPSERERLKSLQMFLTFGAQLVGELIERWERLDRREPRSEGARSIEERLSELLTLYSIWPGASTMVDSMRMDDEGHFDQLPVIAEKSPEIYAVLQDLLDHIANPSGNHADDMAKLEELNRRLLDAARRQPPAPPTHY